LKVALLCAAFLFSVMDQDKYLIIATGSALEFEFVSEGPKGKILKMVVYTPTEIPGLYNFAFGDKNHITGGISYPIPEEWLKKIIPPPTI
jgi:hypothetical protein